MIMEADSLIPLVKKGRATRDAVSEEEKHEMRLNKRMTQKERQFRYSLECWQSIPPKGTKTPKWMLRCRL